MKPAVPMGTALPRANLDGISLMTGALSSDCASSPMASPIAHTARNANLIGRLPRECYAYWRPRKQSSLGLLAGLSGWLGWQTDSKGRVGASGCRTDQD